MKKTRFTEDQMVTILREADRRPVPELAKQHGVSAQTIYSWRKHVGTLEPADVKRLRQLEQENGRLKTMVAERDLEIDVLGHLLSRHGAPRYLRSNNGPEFIATALLQSLLAGHSRVLAFSLHRMTGISCGIR